MYGNFTLGFRHPKCETQHWPPRPAIQREGDGLMTIHGSQTVCLRTVVQCEDLSSSSRL